MSKPQPLTSRAGSTDAVPGNVTTTLVRADPLAQSEAKGEQLHPLLRAQLRELELRTGTATPDLAMLLRLGKPDYRHLDDERRGIVESMRLMADEARSIANEARDNSTEHLQFILDHIKDVVMTVDDHGMIRTLHPTAQC